jgi:hypothetical protein
MRLLCVLVLLPWGAIALAQGASRPDSISEVQLSTSATRTVPPDLAILRIGIMTDHERAAVASRANARVAAAVRDTLRAIDIPLDSLSMSSYTVRPRRDGVPAGHDEILVRRIGFHPERRTLHRKMLGGLRIGAAGPVFDPSGVDTLNFWMQRKSVPVD